MRHAAFALGGMLLLAAAAFAQDDPRACLPEELRMRAKFSEPAQLAASLAAVEKPRKRAAKREVLAQRFRDAGCASVEEQTGKGISEPNLICRIPGKSARTIAIGSSPQLDGWASAALLPEIARAVASAPREHSYAIAAFARTVPNAPTGSRVFLGGFGESAPAMFLHVGAIGAAQPKISPESDAQLACGLETFATSLGTSIGRARNWEQVDAPCVSAHEPDKHYRPSIVSCNAETFAHWVDTEPFVGAAVPALGVHALQKRDTSGITKPDAVRLDPATYVVSYRLLAAYAVVLDQIVAMPAPTAP